MTTQPIGVNTIEGAQRFAERERDRIRGERELLSFSPAIGGEAIRRLQQESVNRHLQQWARSIDPASVEAGFRVLNPVQRLAALGGNPQAFQRGGSFVTRRDDPTARAMAQLTPRERRYVLRNAGLDEAFIDEFEKEFSRIADNLPAPFKSGRFDRTLAPLVERVIAPTISGINTGVNTAAGLVVQGGSIFAERGGLGADQGRSTGITFPGALPQEEWEKLGLKERFAEAKRIGEEEPLGIGVSFGIDFLLPASPLPLFQAGRATARAGTRLGRQALTNFDEALQAARANPEAGFIRLPFGRGRTTVPTIGAPEVSISPGALPGSSGLTKPPASRIILPKNDPLVTPQRVIIAPTRRATDAATVIRGDVPNVLSPEQQAAVLQEAAQNHARIITPSRLRSRAAERTTARFAPTAPERGITAEGGVEFRVAEILQELGERNLRAKGLLGERVVQRVGTEPFDINFRKPATFTGEFEREITKRLDKLPKAGQRTVEQQVENRALRIIKGTGEPQGTPPGGAPPTVSGGAGMVPPGPRAKFTPAIEEAIYQLSNATGTLREVWEYGLRAARSPSVPPSGVRKAFRLAKVWDQSVRRNVDVQQSYLSAVRYQDAQEHFADQTLRTFQGMLDEAFGADALRGQNVLRNLYVGPDTTGRAIDRYVGTLFHVIDSPGQYNLNPLQARAVREIGDIINLERNFTESVGLKIGEVDDIYISHSFKDPRKASNVLSKQGRLGGGRAGATRERRHTLEELAEIGERNGLEIETDVMRLYANRLAGTARMRSNVVFLDSLAPKVGGFRLKPGQAKSSFAGVVEANGVRWQFPPDIADEVNALIKGSPIDPLERGVSEIADLMRGTFLNFDLFGGRQWLLSFLVSPVETLKATGVATQMLMTKQGALTYYTQNAPRMMWWAQHGAQLRTSAIDIRKALTGAPSLLDRVPVAGWMNRAQFEVALPVLKMRMMDNLLGTAQAIRDGKGLQGVVDDLPIWRQVKTRIGKPIAEATDDDLGDAIADAVNNWLGGIEWAKVGANPGVLRKFLILTEGWTRAQVGAHLSVFKGDVQGVFARRLLAAEYGMAASIATATSLALTGELPEYDPRSTRFLDVKLPGGGHVQLLPHKATTGALVRTVAGKKPGEFGADANAVMERISSSMDFFETRQGQVPSMLRDMARGHDFTGRPVNGWDMGLRLIPLLGQQILDEIDTGSDPENIGARTALQFLGFNTRPPSWTDEVNELTKSLSIDATGAPVPQGDPNQVTEYYKLEPSARGLVQQTDEFRAINERRKGPRTESQLLAQIRSEESAQQQMRDDQLLANDAEMGPDKWRESLFEAALAAGERGDLAELLGLIRERGAENENERALFDYYLIADEYENPETGDFDRVGYRAAVERYLASLTPEQRDYVQRNLHPNATPLVRRYYDHLDLKRELGWYDIHTTHEDWAGLPDAWKRVYEDYLDVRARGGDRAVRQWLNEFANPSVIDGFVRDVDREVAALRIQLRIDNPDLDRGETLFYEKWAATPAALADALRRTSGRDQLDLLIDAPGRKADKNLVNALKDAGVKDMQDLVDTPTTFILARDPTGLLTAQDIEWYKNVARLALAEVG